MENATKLKSGDIRLRIETTKANQLFPLFNQITTEEGGFVSVDWGDGNKETLTGTTTYSLLHVYAKADEYIVKLTGSKFTVVEGVGSRSYNDFQVAVKEILSLKMPTDSIGVSLAYAFYRCTYLTGNIPMWDNCIVNTNSTYEGCTSLTGNIPKWGVNITDANSTYRLCTSLTGNIPKWGSNIIDAYSTYYGCTGLSGNIPAWGKKITNATYTYWGCAGLTGSIPKWGTNIVYADYTYERCTGLTGNIPEWGANITDAYGTYIGCTGLSGNIPAWGAKITYAGSTYSRCTGLTGNIPAWGAKIVDVGFTYYYCTGLTGCSKELLQDPMPSKITDHNYCVEGCVDEIRKHFKPDWGGTKKELPGTGDIRLRIETTRVNQFFSLFYQITTENSGFVCVDWGDGRVDTLTGKTTYSPKHTYAKAGEYIVKLTGSKFTGVEGIDGGTYNDFQVAVKEILSLKMPTDSTEVSLAYAFYGCTNLTGVIPAWDDCVVSAESTYRGCTGLNCGIPSWGVKITGASSTYRGCTGLTGRIPEWGTNITDVYATYYNCAGLTCGIPEWGANITDANYTYRSCTGLTGSIPSWGTKITSAFGTYKGCTGLTGCSEELLQDPMPSRITSHYNCVYGCADVIRKHFTEHWGGLAVIEL